MMYTIVIENNFKEMNVFVYIKLKIYELTYMNMMRSV